MVILRNKVIIFFSYFFLLVTLGAGVLHSQPRVKTAGDLKNSSLDSKQKISLESVLSRTLEKNTQIQLQRQVVSQRRGAYRSAHGQFDLNFNSTLSGSREFEQYNSEDPVKVTGYQLGLGQKFLTGTVLSPYASAQKAEQVDPLTNTEIVGYSGKAGFKVKQPLTRNFGVEAVGAEQRRARAEFASAEKNLIHRTANSLKEVTTAYSNYLASLRQVEIRRGSLDRIRELYEATKKLVEKDEIPESDLAPLQASRANKRSQLISARQQVNEARSALGLAIGLDEEKISQLPAPENIFKKISYDTKISEQNLQQLVQKALARRFDYQARENKIEAARNRLAKAENHLSNPLDLEVDLFYKSGRQEDNSDLYYDVYGEEESGLNVTGQLTYSWPVGNNRAEGNYEQSQSLLEQQLTRREQLQRQIKTKVRIAFDNLRARLKSYRQTKKSMGYYRETLEAERRKHQMGMATVLDVINTEEKLTGAAGNLVEARRQLVNALVELRFQTGRLLTKENGIYTVSAEQILSMEFGEMESN